MNPNTTRKLVIALAILCGIGFIAMWVFQYVVRTYSVMDRAMEPALPVGTVVWVRRGHEVPRGAIVAARRPPEYRQIVVLRVAGVGGDSVEGTLVPKDHYFLIGDNRAESVDSRTWGVVSRDQIIGPAIYAMHPSRGFFNP